jgi:hypothetical protein
MLDIFHHLILHATDRLDLGVCIRATIAKTTSTAFLSTDGQSVIYWCLEERMGLHMTYASCCFKAILGKYCISFCATAFTPNHAWNL